MNVLFTNDNNTTIDLINHPFLEDFSRRDNHEVFFRRIHSFLIKNKIIKGNIIDLGAWIGDNSLPWAKQIPHTVYAIDPSPQNIDFIEKMKIHNKITNIKTIQKPISDKVEIISTNDSINHCAFNKNINGRTQLEAVSLDFLLEEGEIQDIDYIHLDVEGFEFNVIKGADKLINKYNPIITFEQHLNQDPYIEISRYLHEKNYNVYLINEELLGCRDDCRNLIAFPRNRLIDINEIHHAIGKSLLLSVFNFTQKSFNSEYFATIYGNAMSGNIFNNTKSIIVNDNIKLFSVHDKNYTKIVAVDKNNNWLLGKYILGIVNIDCYDNIINTFNTAYGIVNNKDEYNIKNLVRI